MNIKKYKEKKLLNLVQIIAIGNGHALVSKQFDPELGSELDDEVTTLDRPQLVALRDDLEFQIEQIDELIEDIDNVDSLGKTKWPLNYSLNTV